MRAELPCAATRCCSWPKVLKRTLVKGSLLLVRMVNRGFCLLLALLLVLVLVLALGAAGVVGDACGAFVVCFFCCCC